MSSAARSSRKPARGIASLEAPLDAWFRIAKKAVVEESGGRTKDFFECGRRWQVDGFQYQRQPVPADHRDQLRVRPNLHPPRS